MVKLSIQLFAIASLFSLASSLETYAVVLSRVFFQVHPAGGQLFNLTSNITYARQFCPTDVSISWVVHGWSEGFYKTKWVPLVVNSTLQYAGGCVVFMDYSYFAKLGYGDLVARYYLLRDALINTMKLFGNYEKMHVFGFSFGARLAIGAGNNITNLYNKVPQIPRMDLCEPAGPNFASTDKTFAPANRSASLVQIINTNSFGYGTGIYDGHINFKMGHCGLWQDGQGSPPMGSHGMCPYMYNHAFTYDYKYDGRYKNECNYAYTANRPINTTCQQTIIMGRRNNVLCYGDVLIPTAICAPYIYNNTIYNYAPGKVTCT
ncbi:hypothetical protein ACKWTF_013525 [Chironomus riparius]